MPSYAAPGFEPAAEPRRRGHAGLVVLIAVLALLCVVGGYALAFALSGRQMISSAQELAGAVADVQQLAESGEADFARVRSDARQMADAASAMKAQADGIVWQIAELIPVYGQDAAAVRALAGVADDLARGALAPVVEALPGDDFASMNVIEQAAAGIEALGALKDVLPQVTGVVGEATAEVNGIGELHIAQLNDAVAQVREPLNEVNDALADVNAAASSLASLLGLGA